MSIYRTPAEIAADIPPARRLRVRTRLAYVIVAPVRLFWWCAPWLMANLAVNAVLIAPWVERPKAVALIVLALNVLAGLVWGAYRAYRWAEAEIRSVTREEP